MNGRQICEILQTRLGDEFQGVYACDMVSRMNIDTPGCFVANTQSSSEKGEHWVAFYVDKDDKADYFDTTGSEPTNQYFLHYLAKCREWDYNKRQVQGVATTCGQYCIFFLLMRSKGLGMLEIVDLFDSSDFAGNDLGVGWLIDAMNVDEHIPTYDLKFYESNL